MQLTTDQERDALAHMASRDYTSAGDLEAATIMTRLADMGMASRTPHGYCPTRFGLAEIGVTLH